MADTSEGGEGGSGDWEGDPGGPAQGVPGPPAGGESLALPKQSPLFHGQEAGRYERQEWIRAYQAEFGCRLVVMKDEIFSDGVTLFEDLVFDADKDQDLHLMLGSPGGDGETAVRLVRSAQARCRELTVIVPDQAKSAATLLTMGAHHILMGPTSDLGPIDPQFRIDGGLTSAKNILAAVNYAEEAVQKRPETYPIHASLLSNVTALMVQHARSAIARTDQVAMEALRSCPGRDEATAIEMWSTLKTPLAEEPADHSAVFDGNAAKAAGLPVTVLDPFSRHWQFIWRLWVKYALIPGAVYEGQFSSQVRIHPLTS